MPYPASVSNPTIRERIMGAFMGVLLGDTLGMPVEKKTHAQIMEMTAGHGITTFLPSAPDGFRAYKAGETTDDWQLARAVIRSLIRTKGVFDIVDCANEHVKEWEPETTTWGKTTHKEIEKIKNGLRDPREPLADSKAGDSSGIMMKVVGLSAAHALRNTSPWDLADDVFDLGKLTHPNPVASVTAYTVAEIIRCHLLGRFVNIPAIVKMCRELDSDPTFPDLLDGIQRMSIPQLRELPFKPFSAIKCAMIGIGVALQNTNKFRNGVLSAINCGGDSDTNGSIVGAIIGANVGYDGIPVEWQTFLTTYDEVVYLTRDFEKACGISS